MKKLKTGVAYHGNRLLSHAISDMNTIARSDMDLVVHMFSHNDWERHDEVMKDIFKATEERGLEVWVDNWGIGGAPGEKCHFLAYHPEAHTYYGNGQMHPYQICLNAPSYRQFVKDWAYRVAEIGGKTVFWDEPFIPEMKLEGSDCYYSSCTCPTCRAMFKERYGREMPEIMDKDVADFRNDTIIEFHSFASSYAASLGMKNVVCFMPYQLAGIQNQSGNEAMMALDISKICEISTIDNVGTDPYWFEQYEPYEYVYNTTKTCVSVADSYGKDHNMWIQAYGNPEGTEEDIVEGFEAAYDGGARTIIAWSYLAGESNNYRSANPMRAWDMTVEGNRRIKAMDRDKRLEELRAKYKK